MYLKEIKTRLSWLSIGLALSLIIAHVISGFDDVLNSNLILASFIPLIVYMSDAVGTQMEAMIIRELSRKKKFNFKIFLKKQSIIVVSVGFIISAVAGLVLYAWKQDTDLSLIVSISLMAGIMTSLITGAFMPYFFWKIHKDPAEASGPIATVLQDLLSVTIFFLVARAFYG